MLLMFKGSIIVKYFIVVMYSTVFFESLYLIISEYSDSLHNLYVRIYNQALMLALEIIIEYVFQMYRSSTHHR